MSALQSFSAFINILLDVAVDPVTEGGNAGKHWWFLVSDAALSSKADNAVHLPGWICSSSSSGSCAGEGTAGVTLPGDSGTKKSAKIYLWCTAEHLILAAAVNRLRDLEFVKVSLY